MKTDLNQRRKYAFNINEIKIKKKFQGSLNDFQKLNRGTYDEIESNDMLIKENKQKLKDLKNLAVKEFVYTNKDIPDHWKSKLDYQQNLLKMFTNDTKFLFYLGRGGGGDAECFRTIKESEKNDTHFNTLNKYPKEKKSFPKLNSIKRLSISPMKKMSNNQLKRNGRFKESNIPDKDILGILDDFKNAYPLFDKEKNNHDNDKDNNNNSKENILYNIDKKSKTVYNSRNSRIFHKNTLTSKKKVSIDMGPLNSLPSLKQKQKHSRRQNTFRQNIFTNLLPSNDKYGKTYTKNMTGVASCTDVKKKKIDKKKKGNSLFLNLENDAFDKKIKINNPNVIKYLEGINYYGPYFSYCPPCGNRNLEFYKNLEINQCLRIIQQIKKNKGKTLVLNSEKNKENKLNRLETIDRNIQENENSVKYNSKSLYNNDEENDSLLQQYSASEEKEKYDVFD
jgi:hypothetical protein